MLNIRDPIVATYTQPTGTTTSDPDDFIVTSVMMRPPTDRTGTTNSTVATYQDLSRLTVVKTDGNTGDDCTYRGMT